MKTRAESIERDIDLMVSSTLSPSARSMLVAEYAREQIAEADAGNRQVLGRQARHTVSVDGRMGAALETVNPDRGVIIAEWELLLDVLIWISEKLKEFSPVKSGKYRASHTIFADSVEVQLGARLPNDAEEFVFINNQPYARKIERGRSSQAPDGVYQATAALARQRFGNIARISFSYRTAISGVFVGGTVGNRSSNRNPAIIVRQNA